MNRITAIVLAVTFACLLALPFRSRLKSEPEYQGKPLRHWSQQWRTNWFPAHAGKLEAKASFDEAEAAIRAVGTNAVPSLLELLQAKEAPLVARIRKLVPRSWESRLNLDASLRGANELRSIGANGLAALGTNAAIALPSMIAMLQDPGSSSDLRCSLMWSMQFMGSAAEPAIPTLIECLDPQQNSSVRSEAIGTLASINRQHNIVVPALMEHLAWRTKASTGNGESIRILDAFSAFGTNAVAATTQVIRLLSDSDIWVRTAATNSIRRIDPGSALPVGMEPQFKR